MKILLVTIFITYLNFTSFTQSLTPERIAKIKACTVRIVVDGATSGTGFFVSTFGSVLTCWHVIEPAIIRDSLHRIINLKPILMVLSSGEKISVGIANYCMQKGLSDAMGYDYCLLSSSKDISTDCLKFGDFDSLSEGEDVYTCGFPIGIEQPFVSKGMVSTKFIDSLNSITNNGKVFKIKRYEALLDITLNAGNSGGAIIKIGKTLDDDQVIGLADFIVNPIGDVNENFLINQFSKGVGKYKGEGIDPNSAFIYFTEILSKISMGVSGCISTNHFLNGLNNIKN